MFSKPFSTPKHIIDLMRLTDIPVDLNDLQKNPDFETLIKNHQRESADLKNVLAAILACHSDYMRNVLLNQISSVTNFVKDYNITLDVRDPLEYLTKQTQQIYDVEYWEALGTLLRLRYILPYHQDQAIFSKYKKAYLDETHFPFNEDNINKLIAELKQFFTTANIATEFDLAKSGLVIKTFANGNLELKSTTEMGGYIPALKMKAYDLFLNWFHQIIFCTYNNPVQRLNAGVNNMEISWQQSGMTFETRKNGIIVLKMNKSIANKFSEITGCEF